MEVRLTPDLQAQLDKLAAETGRARDELIKDAVVGYFAELAQTQEMLDRRYDEVKSGKNASLTKSPNDQPPRSTFFLSEPWPT